VRGGLCSELTGPCSLPLNRNARGLGMLAARAGVQSALGKALKKRTGALTVSVEFERDGEGGSTENDLLVLSMRLRQMNVATVWTPRSSDCHALESSIFSSPPLPLSAGIFLPAGRGG
jgi:hypothetical protein